MEENEKKLIPDGEIIGEGRGRLDTAMEKALHGKAAAYARLAMVVGDVLLVLHLIFLIFFEGTPVADFAFLFLAIGVFPFAIGLVFTLTYARLRRVAKCGAENRYYFGREDFSVVSYTAAGDLIGMARCRYETIARLAETENYLFLTVKSETQNGIFPILRESMSGETERFLVERVRAAHPKRAKGKGHR